MRVGVAIAQTGWPDQGRTWSFSQMADYAVRAERAGFDSAWCNDHVFLQLGDGPRRLALPDPMVLLSHVAGRTERIELGTLVIGAPFRSPVQLAREARTLHELSGGRFVLGIGAGWHEPELEAIGAPTDRLVSRFEEYLEALVALLRGDGPVDLDGRYIRLRGAEVSGEGTPPIWIGASGPRMLGLTGRLADGWNMPASLHGMDELLGTVRDAERAASRPEGSVVVSTGASVLLVDEEEGERLVAEHPPRAGTVAIGADGLRRVVEEHRAAGCDHLILHFSGAIWSSYGPDQLELAGDALSLPAGGG